MSDHKFLDMSPDEPGFRDEFKQFVRRIHQDICAISVRLHTLEAKFMQMDDRDRFKIANDEETTNQGEE